MAKFVTEDGKGCISGDAFMIHLEHSEDALIYKDNSNSNHVPNHKIYTEIQKLKTPIGKTNSHRLLNMNMYDLLSHIQKTLSLTNKCVIKLITNEDHRCINTNKTIQCRINTFAKEHMSDSFKEANPRGTVRIKKENDEYVTRQETDEEYNDRLCHLYMHQYHPTRLQMIKCEECLQKWLNDDKW